MATFNSIVLAGQAVEDPVLVRGDDGRAACTFRLRVVRRFKDAGGAMREEVCEIGLDVRGHTAETVAAYLRKGGGVLVHGRLAQASGNGGDAYHVSGDAVKFLSAVRPAPVAQAK